MRSADELTARATADDGAVLAYEDLAVELGTRRVERAGVAIALSAREFDLLVVLARSPGRIYPRAHLLALVWGSRRALSTTTVEGYVRQLRAKIDVPPCRPLIHTIRDVGYTLR